MSRRSQRTGACIFLRLAFGVERDEGRATIRQGRGQRGQPVGIGNGGVDLLVEAVDNEGAGGGGAGIVGFQRGFMAAMRSRQL